VAFSDHNRLGLFDNGRDGLAAMLDEIGRAQQSIDLETYILRSDITGRRFLEALADRARAGVRVRLIYDALGSRNLNRKALWPLLGAGGLANEFNPLGRSIRKRIIRRRDHRKLLIVDGRIGFVGGLNIGDEYAAEVDDTPAWRDAHARVEGPVARELARLFDETWAHCEGASAIVTSDPDVPSGDADRARDVLRGQGQTRAAVLADGPIYRRRRMRETVMSGLDDARSNVLLVSPYFVPGRGLLDTLERAARRGVHIDILIAGRSDHPIFRRAARAFVPRLIDCGVRVFEDTERMMHAKVAAFDDHLSIIGTSNLDRQSLYHSYEVSLLVEGSDAAAWIRDHFGPAGAEPVDADALARRGGFTRAIDFVLWSLIRLI